MSSKNILIIAVEDEPFPRGPSGESYRLKLKDWLDLANQLGGNIQLEICSLSEMGSRKPDIVEAFATRDQLLSNSTFPTRKEHDLTNRFSNYWSTVEKSGVPAIGVIKGAPIRFPVFVRGEQGTFAGGGLVRTAAELKRLRQSGRPLVVRPWVDIRSADKRQTVRLELRVHVVAGYAAAVEYLFPPWAAQRPTMRELNKGRAWMESQCTLASQHAERIAAELGCRWFVADFAGTKEGLQLVEINPGWCAGIAHDYVARAVHLAILTKVFKIRAPISS